MDVDAPIVVVDNGAHTIKAGVLGASAEGDSLVVIPNAIARPPKDNAMFIGHELLSCKDFTSLRYRLPFEKGFLVDWDAQKAIWDGLFSNEVLGVKTSDSSLLITEPYFNLPNIQDVYDQFVFEEYEFRSYYRCAPASLIPYGNLLALENEPKPECLVVIDSGFSFTHVVPILRGSIVWEAVRRINVGGKLLTNHLKELVSFRQWDMMEQTHIMNEVKETCCFVSSNVKMDLEICRAHPTRNAIVQEYIFPNYAAKRQGHVRQPNEQLEEGAQVLHMNNERFMVPEVVFHPTDIGLEQAGIAQTVAASIAALPPELHGLFWANIGLVGGTTAFPNFSARLLTELRALAPVDCEVVVFPSTSPVTEAYRSALAFARTTDFAQRVVTKAEYEEHGGPNACRRKFRDWKPAAEAAPPREAPRARGARATAKADSDSGRDSSPPPARRGGRGRGRGRGAGRRQA